MAKRLLIIEDDEDSRLLYSEIAGSIGLEISEAWDLKTTAESLNNPLPGLVIMDLTMDHFVPSDFLADLRALPGGSEVPVILISGRDDLSVQAERLQADEMLKKPIDLDVMIETLTKWST